MGSPELIRQITDSRRKEREAVERKRLLQQRDPEEVAHEASNEKIEVDRICSEIRIDCVNLLNSQGEIKRSGLFDKRRFLQRYISDDEGEPVIIRLVSSNKEPAKSSEIILGIVGLEDNYLGFYKGKCSIYKVDPTYIPRSGLMEIRSSRTPNLEDANNWKEVVDALKEQRQ